jgi:hypothetical protein
MLSAELNEVYKILGTVR